MRTFIMQLYAKEIIPPSEIITPVLPAESKSLAKWLSQRKEKTVKIASPKSGKKKELIGMSSENATFIYRARQEGQTDEILHDLKERLSLIKPPADIGAFDVSNISGNEAVGAFIYWSGGLFRKDRYRRLKIKTVKGIDDYSMMEELIERIINNLEGDLPDLIIIDGGKGHLEVGKRVISRNIHDLKSL